MAIVENFDAAFLMEPPVSLTRPMRIPHKTLMGPGPSNCSPRVLQAMSQPILGHLHEETVKLMDEIKDGLRYVFQTKNRLTLAISASGHGGMEASLSNVLEPGDTVLIAVNGIWGERASTMAERYGAKVAKLTTEPGRAIRMQDFEHAIQDLRPCAVFVTHSESSTGVAQPVEGLGEICRRYGSLLIVDAVASLGAVPLYMDRWKIDVMYTGSQKALGAPPGITPISFNERAVEKILKRKTPVLVFYWDMTLLGKYWNCFDGPRMYHHTISATLVYGLREALAQFCEEGLENSWKRHRLCADKLHDGVKRLGLELFVEQAELRLPTVTTIRVPNENWPGIIQYAMKTYNLEISGGLGPTVGKVMRIGLMGYNATTDNVELVLKVLREALVKSKL